MTQAQGPALIWCPFPNADSAESVAGVLLDEGLIACANLLPGLTSLYVWEGQRHRESETGVLMKTDAALLDRTIARVQALHPYDLPAVLGWRCDGAAPATAAWLGRLISGA